MITLNPDSGFGTETILTNCGLLKLHFCGIGDGAPCNGYKGRSLNLRLSRAQIAHSEMGILNKVEWEATL